MAKPDDAPKKESNWLVDGKLRTATKFSRTFTVPSEAGFSELSDKTSLWVKYTVAVSRGKIDPIEPSAWVDSEVEAKLAGIEREIDYKAVVLNSQLMLLAKNGDTCEMEASFEMFE